jgi:hypothetical protein
MGELVQGLIGGSQQFVVILCRGCGTWLGSFVSVAGRDAVELVARADVELGEDLVQVASLKGLERQGAAYSAAGQTTEPFAGLDGAVLAAGIIRCSSVDEVGEVIYLFLGESSIRRYEGRGSDSDDDPDVGIKDRRDEVVPLLESLIKDRLSVGDHRLDPAADLKRPIWIIGVLDVERNPWVVFEVAVLLPVPGVRKADSFPVPGEPHHAALGTSIRPKGGEMSEEWSLK